MAEIPPDEFLVSDFEVAQKYIKDHPQYALCRVRHDVNIHRPPADAKYVDGGGWVYTYICGGCKSEHYREYWADGRWRRSWWSYEDDYKAERGSGYALQTRSGKAAFNIALRNAVMGKAPDEKPRRRTGRK